MAETSGFFDAKELADGTWDRVYIAQQFANYFKLFIGNGVFFTPTNQLKVVSSSGMTVKVSSGWAFINGYWYHNDSDLELEIPANVTASTVKDGIFLQFNATDRTISAVVTEGRTEVNRTAPIYELKLAEVSVATGAVEITDAKIADTRSNSDVCGFVTGLLDVIDTSDLFAQYTAIFNDWFDQMKDQLTEDAAGHLQEEVDDVNHKIHTNLINVFAEDMSASGVYLTSNYDGTYELSGTASADVYFDITDSRTPIETYWPKLKAGKYRIVGDSPSNGVTLYVQETNTEGTLRTGVFEVANDNTPYRVRLKIDNGTVLNGRIVKPMLTSNLSATYDDFVQYSGNGEVNENLALLYKKKQDANSDYLNTSNKSIIGAINELNALLKRTESRTVTAFNNFTIVNNDYRCKENIMGFHINIAFVVPQISEGWHTVAEMTSAFGNAYDDYFDAFAYVNGSLRKFDAGVISAGASIKFNVYLPSDMSGQTFTLKLFVGRAG